MTFECRTSCTNLHSELVSFHGTWGTTELWSDRCRPKALKIFLSNASTFLQCVQSMSFRIQDSSTGINLRIKSLLPQMQTRCTKWCPTANNCCPRLTIPHFVFPHDTATPHAAQNPAPIPSFTVLGHVNTHLNVFVGLEPTNAPSRADRQAPISHQVTFAQTLVDCQLQGPSHRQTFAGQETFASRQYDSF